MSSLPRATASSFVFASLALIGLLVAGPGPAHGQAGAPVTLNLVSWSYGVEIVRDNIDKFQQKYPGVTVGPRAWTSPTVLPSAGTGVPSGRTTATSTPGIGRPARARRTSCAASGSTRSSPSSREIVRYGLVSVSPYVCAYSARNVSRTRRTRCGEIAEPPERSRRSAG